MAIIRVRKLVRLNFLHKILIKKLHERDLHLNLFAYVLIFILCTEYFNKKITLISLK